MQNENGNERCQRTKKEGKEKEERTRVEVGRNEGERERSEKGGEEGSHA